MTLDELKKLYAQASPGSWSSTHIYDGEERLRCFNVHFKTEDQHMDLGSVIRDVDGKLIEAMYLVLPSLIRVAETALKVEASCQMGPDGCTVDAGVMMDLNEAFEALGKP